MRRILSTFVLCASVALWAADAAITVPHALPRVAARGDVRIAVRGEKAAYTIVIRTDATPCERRAASELQAYLCRLTGVELPIVDDGGPLPERAILLGDTRPTRSLLSAVATERDHPGVGNFDLGEEGFRLKVVAPHLIVQGGTGRGPLYGVYELLERFGGCAWYSLRFEVVPPLEAFSVPADLDETQRPAFVVREENWNGCDARAQEHAVRNKLNPTFLGEELGGSRHRFDPVLGKCHTFYSLVSPERWFDAHPEYFSFVDGRRRRRNGQLCLTNPNVVRICTAEVLARIADSYPKGVRYYGVSPNDWGNACECSACAAVDRRAKSRAGTLIAFVNQIAEAVEKRYPDVFIQTLAYSYTRHPPEGVVPRRNVDVCLCTIECDFSRPIPESRAIENRRVRYDFGRWAKADCALSVWDYATDFGCYHHPWPNYRALRGNLAFFRDNGVSQVFTLGNGGGPNEVWSNIRCWLLAKWMWNPDQDEDALLARCFRDHFGPAAGTLRCYFDLLRNQVRDTKRFPLGCFANVYGEGIDDGVLEKAAELLDQAAEETKGSAWEENVRLARIPVDFTRAMRGAARPNLSWKAVDLEKWRAERDGARRVVALMDRPEGLRLCDDTAGNVSFGTRLRALAAQEAPPEPGTRRIRLEETYLTGSYPATLFRYEDDPRARDGRAVKLLGNLESCTAWLDFRSLKLDPEGLYVPRVRVRTSAAETNALPFRAGVYNRTWRRAVRYFEPEDVPGESTTGYRWYSLGTVSPKPGDHVWVGLGAGPTPDAPAPDVWIDQLEIVRVR